MIILTNGCFDIFHAGHARLLQYAKEYAEFKFKKKIHLWVALDSDESVKKLKGENRPINKFMDRFTVLSHNRFVDGVYEFAGGDIAPEINTFKPVMYFKGCDYSFSQLSALDQETLTSNRVLVEFFPLLTGVSTSIIADKIKAESAGAHQS